MATTIPTPLEVTTDQARLDVALIYRFLSEQSSWALGIPRATVERSIENSLCFGGFVDGAQVAFARVISDFATFAYLVDVFVLPEQRGRGRGKALMAAVLAHPALQGLRRFMLATSTAHDLYAQFGFAASAKPQALMEVLKPDVYKAAEMRALCLLVLLLAGGAAEAQAPAPCVIVYGNGRNLGDARENEAWDRANLRFNTAVVERLAASGLRALPMVFRVGELTPRASVDLLVAQVQRQGCQRVVDTAVFANEESAALVVRLRVHPVLASLGPRLATAQPTIGEPLFTSQRDFDLNPKRPLDTVPLEALARQMVEDYLAGQGLNQPGR